MSEENVVNMDVAKSEDAVSQPSEVAVPSAVPKFRVGVIGNNSLGRASDVAFNTKTTERKLVNTFDDLDELIEWKPQMAVICEDIPILKNDTLDDSAIVDAVNKLIRQIDCAICIRSTLNIETIERMILSVGPQAFDAKVIYMPCVGDPDDVGQVLSAEYSLIGGGEKAIPAFLKIVRETSQLSATEVQVGTVFEVAYAKLGISGFKAVKQSYFNQLYDTILDVKNANPINVRRMMEKSNELVDRSTMIPTFIRAQVEEDVTYKQARAFAGEYLNRDARMLVGMTDKLPLLDECINFKNLKDQ